MTVEPLYDPYPYLRQLVDPSLALLGPRQLRARIDTRFGEGAADGIESDTENIFRGIGRAFSGAARDVGRFVQQNGAGLAQIGGGIVQGATAGAAGGPIGMIAGAALGGTGAGLRTFGRGSVSDVGNAIGSVTNLAGQLTPMGRLGGTLGQTIGSVGGALASGRGAGGIAGIAGQLLPQIAGRQGGAGGLAGLGGAVPQIAGALGSLFGGRGGAMGQFANAVQRPEVQQALGAAQLGSLGRTTVPVGATQTPVPTGAFLQMLSQLLGEAAQEWAETAGEGESSELDYLRDNGEFVGDPSSPQDRAARLWALLNAAQSERLDSAVETILVEAEQEFEGEAEWQDSDWSGENDALELLLAAEAEDLNAALDLEMLDHA